MPARSFKNLDEYEDFLKSALASWSAEQRIILAAGMAERWLPAYESFSAEEDWGDPAILRRALNQVWDRGQRIRSSGENWSHLKQQIHEITPHMDDFDANEALCACVMVQYAIEGCAKADNQASVLMALLSGLEAVMPDILDGELPASAWKQPVLRREIARQLSLLEEVRQLGNLSTARQSLESFLANPRMSGELGASRREKTAPSGPSNQQAFEQYSKIIQNDIRSASSGLDPRQNPGLATILYVSSWMGRYSRRKQILSGEYGSLIDQTAVAMLLEKNRAFDLAEPEIPAWDEQARQTIDMVYQNTHNGMDVHAIENPHAYGPSLRRLWLDAKRRGLADAQAWEHIAHWAHHQPGTWGRQAQKTSAARLQPFLSRPLTWERTGDPLIPWSAGVDEAVWQVRLNDFPDEMMYSLLINGDEVGDFHEWPAVWERE